MNNNTRHNTTELLAPLNIKRIMRSICENIFDFANNRDALETLTYLDIILDKIYEFRSHCTLTRCKKIGTNVGLRMPVTIYHPENLILGNDISIGEYTHIRASGGVSIGNRVLIASHVVITSRSHPTALPRFGITEDYPIKIEDDVWIGAGAIILPGSIIKRGAVIAAGAVVTGTIDPFTVAGGIPARTISKTTKGGN